MFEVFFPIAIIWLMYIGVGVLAFQFLQTREKIKVVSESPAYIWSVSFLIGAGVVTLGEFVLSLIKVPFWISLCGFGAIALYSLFLYRHTLCSPTRKPQTIFTILFWIGTVIMMFFFFTRSISRVTYTWDSIAFWTPKMFALWSDQTVHLEGLRNFNHPEYPLLLPLTGANAFTIVGEYNEVSAKAVIFGFSLALFLLIGNALLTQKSSKLQKVFWMVLFLSIFIVREHVAGEYAGTADIFVGTYFVAGTIALLKKHRLIALVLWLFAAWNKSEGLVFAGVTTLLLFLSYPSLRKWIVFSFATIAVPWQLFTKLSGLGSQYFAFGSLYARPWIEYAVYSVHAFREEFRNLQKWNLVFFFFLAQSFCAIKRIAQHKELRIIYAGLTVQLLSYMVIFTIAPEEQASFIAAAISRLTLHLAPTALIVTAYLFSQEFHAKHQKT
ncbi:MAG: hypothetical protein A2840_02520 [Candidatus Buchananbacteria bacterium RIFCSPHIGHO2_01_FULL_47_11b]|uniref:Glycosyltransferase RgtA/B/C/D-like domain-containing protein n=1 Tax=Candidatus Buchananbacteria bacterium RIFCSPHIGHO2_01_FULL_47_11b TaxID=1797537 RepID=A0A1G1Y1H7_9BACT|nr:MAG: hypothetical protein A2840_02520 [Candidatus Buchananbacteria bacterium RIFCSPHIGHO2_01_FULL_47_11b]